MERDDLLSSEFASNGELLGLTGAEDLLGRIARLPKEKQARAFQNLLRSKPSAVKQNSPRAEFLEKVNQLPEDIQKGLLNQRLQMVDTRYYIVKEIGGKSSIDVFQGTDNKNVGLANIASQKLEKDQWFILSAIRLTYAEAVSRDVADFGLCPAIILNGEFELEAGGKNLFGLTDTAIFDTKNRTDIQTGFYKLDSTKIIEPQTEIKMPFKFSSAANPSSFLRVTFIGAGVVPY